MTFTFEGVIYFIHDSSSDLMNSLKVAELACDMIHVTILMTQGWRILMKTHKLCYDDVVDSVTYWASYDIMFYLTQYWSSTL